MFVFIGLVTWGLFSIAKSLFTRTSNLSTNTDTVQIEQTQDALDTAGIVTFEVNGPVVANEDHRSYVISVTNSTVNIKLYERYGAKVIDQKSYPNTQDAYDAFIAALAQENVLAVKGSDSEDFAYNEEGVCARGKRYILEIDRSIRRWTTSCSSKDGNADFSMSRVRSLFQKQVPDYREVISGSGL